MEAAGFKFSRYTIRRPDEADWPRSRRDLNAQRALGAVLDKREWWTKWTTKPDVRARWLEEIDAALVAANVSQVLTVWPQYLHPSPFDAFEKVLEQSAGAERETQIQDLLAHVQFPPPILQYDPFKEGEYYDSDGEYDDEDGDDSGDDSAPSINTSLDAASNKKNPFCQIGWYVTMAITQESFRGVPSEERTEETMESLLPANSASRRSTGAAVDRTRSLILAVLASGPVTVDSVKAHLPDETRDDVLALLRLHFHKIQLFLQVTRRHISRILDMQIKLLGLGSSSSGGGGNDAAEVRPGPVPQTCVSDGLISTDLKSTFVSQVAILENEDKDWHPNSNNQVLDLVHPSLFCGAQGHTKMLSSSSEQDTVFGASAADHMRRIVLVTASQPLELNRTSFQWLPCEVDVDGHGQATIRTYINNLHPETHAGLYDSIASIFSRFVPLFDRVLSTLDDALPLHAPEGAREAIGVRPPTSLKRLVPLTLFDEKKSGYSLKGRRCQVIVKIAEIVLTPEQPEYSGGSWHIEGTDAERIIATGLYYFGCENITESRLSFRVFVREPHYQQSDHVGVGLTYALENDKPLLHHLGSVTAMEDRCLVFPNIYQHKVEPFKLVDPTKPGTRKILAFFLVDPTNGSIPSTAVVPPQQEAWLDQAMEPEIKRMKLPDVVTQQIQDLSRQGMTLELAKQIRLDLMEERSPPLYETDQDNIFSLCEH